MSAGPFDPSTRTDLKWVRLGYRMNAPDLECRCASLVPELVTEQELAERDAPRFDAASGAAIESCW